MTSAISSKWAIASVLAAVFAGGGIGWAVTHMGDDDPKEPERTVATPTSSPTDETPTATEPSPTPKKPAVVKLAQSDLITAAALAPLQSEGGEHEPPEWEQYDAGDVPTFVCQPDWLRGLTPTEKLTREFRAGDGAKVNTAVLRFPNESDAKIAYSTVKLWMTNCDNTIADVDERIDSTKDVDVTNGQGFRADGTHGAPEVCTECDATWFDAMVAAQVGDRLVLTQYSRVGGPLEPINFAEEVSTAVTAVLKAGRAG